MFQRLYTRLTGGVPNMKASRLQTFLEEMTALLKSGMNVRQAMGVLTQMPGYEWAETVERNAARGMTLSDALENTNRFPDDVIETIRMGEESGDLDKVLEQLAELYRTRNETSGKLITKMIYPSFLMFGLGAFLLFVTFYVIPMMQDLVASIGGSSQSFDTLYMIVNVVGPVIGILMLGGPIVFYIMYRYMFSVQKFVFSTPGFRQYFLVKKLLEIFPYVRIMYEAGLNLDDIFERMQKKATLAYTKYVMGDLADHLSRGTHLRDLVDRHEAFFPPYAREVIKSREEAGELGEAFHRIEDYYKQRFNQRMERITEFLTPFFIFLTAIVVGSVMLLVLFPALWSVFQAFSGSL